MVDGKDADEFDCDFLAEVEREIGENVDLCGLAMESAVDHADYMRKAMREQAFLEED